MSDWFEHYGFAEVSPSLFLGAYPQDARDVAALQSYGITRIFNLVQDAEYLEGAREACVEAYEHGGIVEERVELVDFGGLPPAMVERAVQQVLEWLDEGHRVYLHCRAGWQRSAAVAAGVVALRDGVGLPEALDSIRRARPQADPLPHQREDLVRWWTTREA